MKEKSGGRQSADGKDPKHLKCVEMNKDQRGREWLRLNAEVGIEPGGKCRRRLPGSRAAARGFLL